MTTIDRQTLQTRLAGLEAQLARLPRARLAHLPTPLDPCPRLTAELGWGVVVVKRDDCTGLAFGGNKSRQLEFVLGKALAEGADCLVQGASSQSNHARQLSAAGARLGLPVFLVPRQDSHISSTSGELLSMSAVGCDYPSGTAGFEHERRKRANRDQAARRGQKALDRRHGVGAECDPGCGRLRGRVLRGGAAMSRHRYGHSRLGIVTSQGSTQAGLLLRARLLGLETRVVGINPMDSRQEGYVPPEGIKGLVEQAAAMMSVSVAVATVDVVNSTDYVGEAYGVPSRGSLRAIDLLATREGILPDPIYTGKGAARDDRLSEAWHSGSGSVGGLRAHWRPARHLRLCQRIGDRGYNGERWPVVNRPRAYRAGRGRAMLGGPGSLLIQHRSTEVAGLHVGHRSGSGEGVHPCLVQRERGASLAHLGSSCRLAGRAAVSAAGGRSGT